MRDQVRDGIVEDVSKQINTIVALPEVEVKALALAGSHAIKAFDEVGSLIWVGSDRDGSLANLPRLRPILQAYLSFGEQYKLA